MNDRTAPVESRRGWTRATLLVAGVALVLAACGHAGGDANTDDRGAGSQGASPARSADVPRVDFELALFDGSRSSLGAFAGRPAVVNFWASWCPSCVAEMSAAFRPVAEDLGGEVTFIGMNIQDERDRALDLLDQTGVEWINAEDPDGSLFVELGGLGMPFTVFIDPSGAIVDTHNGPLNESQLRDAVSELLSS